MRMYPGYKLRDVLDEYAISFYSLLNEGYRLKYGDMVLLAQITDLPHMKREDRIELYRSLEWAATHPSDILNSSGEGSSPAEIKKILGG